MTVFSRLKIPFKQSAKPEDLRVNWTTAEVWINAHVAGTACIFSGQGPPNASLGNVGDAYWNTNGTSDATSGSGNFNTLWQKRPGLTPTWTAIL